MSESLPSVFISYSSENRAAAARIVAVLEAHAYEVWWDNDLRGGDDLDSAIEAAIDDCQVVVVLWSRSSTASRWVKAEAAAAHKLDKLVAARIDGVSPPLSFRQIHAVDLQPFIDEGDTAVVDKLLEAIHARSDSAIAPPAVDIAPGAPRASGRRLHVAIGIAALVVASAAGYWWNLSRTPKQGDELIDALASGGQGPPMIVRPPGRQQLGSPRGEAGRADDERQHTPLPFPAFAMARHETTVREWDVCVARDACPPKSGPPVADGSVTHGSYLPVVNVSWLEAASYAQWLSDETGQTYRLPTEDEWEYAARGGSTAARHWGDDPSAACSYANVADRSLRQGGGDARAPIHECTDNYPGPMPVETLQPNAFTLYDTLGNVWEWAGACKARTAPEASSDARCRDLKPRGGSWLDGPDSVRLANRYHGGFPAGHRMTNLGFRLVRTLK
jgi:formylglycine-generating enzyme required for sulfatase activity